MVLSRLPLLFLLKRLAWLSPFVLSVALVNALQPGGARELAGGGGEEHDLPADDHRGVEHDALQPDPARPASRCACRAC